jgi:hypothetical protein
MNITHEEISVRKLTEGYHAVIQSEAKNPVKKRACEASTISRPHSSAVPLSYVTDYPYSKTFVIQSSRCHGNRHRDKLRAALKNPVKKRACEASTISRPHSSAVPLSKEMNYT